MSLRAVASPQQLKQCGASRLEFVIVASVVAILITVLLSRIVYYQAAAERVAVDGMIGALRTALAARTGELLLQHRENEVAALAGQNPILLLRAPPPNYGGEVDGGLDKAELGRWYFDRQTQSLVYLLNMGKIFGATERKRLIFKVKSDPIPDGQQARTSGVSLVQLD
ncbi:hypothetical protein [Pseudoduganella sp. RAF53_2]|uniref:hypothetical protein n=1 Tax=unclassified Pseudoduganella TaxID=2637179 RepID=UPI003F9D89DA